MAELGPGELSQSTREDIGRSGSERREDMPEDAFLGPHRTYPVKEQRDGGWHYTEKLLLAAARRARMEHEPEIARRADEIREREFGGDEKGEDDWSPEARAAALAARRAKAGHSVEYPHSASTHTRLAEHHETRAAHYRGRGQHGFAGPHQTKANLHKSAAEALTSRAGNARSLSEKAHAYGARDDDADEIREREFEGEESEDAAFEENKHPRGEGGKFATAAGQAPNYHIANSDPTMKGRHHVLSQKGFSMSSSSGSGGKMSTQGYTKHHTVGGKTRRHQVALQRTGEWSHKSDEEDVDRIPFREGQYINERHHGSGKGKESLAAHLAKHFPSRAEDISVAGAAKAAQTLRARGDPYAKDSLVTALKQKFATPQAAMAALGLDSALLGANEEVGGSMTHLSHASALRVVEALKARGKLALDADPEEMAHVVEGVEMPHTEGDTEPNAGMPWLAEHEEDEDPEFETEEERREDEAADRRARDMYDRLGHEASDEEWEREEERMEFKPDTDRAMEADRKRADDRKRIRADDARRRLGRDETPEECAERERREEAEDRRHARDRRHMADDYRRARDRHHRAMDAMRRHAEDYKRARDAKRMADDAKRADDSRKRADDMRRHAADAKRAYDEVCAARDARMRARDRRRAADRHHHGMDQPPPFKGMPEVGGGMVSKSAMDQAIRDALRDNDSRHRAITDALEAVRPKVGRIAMDGSIQNEADVWGRALDVLGVPHAGITQLAALRQMFVMAPRPGGDGERQRGNGLAQDAASQVSALDRSRKMFGDSFAAIERQ